MHTRTPTYIKYILTNTTISQNVFQLNNFENAYLVFEEELKNLFVLWKSHVPFLQLFILLKSISNHSINFENCDTLMHTGTQVRVYFYVHLVQLINIVISIIFWKNFAQFGGVGPKSRPFLIHQPTVPQLIKKLFNECTKTIQNSKHTKS